MLVKKFVNGSVPGAPTTYTIVFQGAFTSGSGKDALPLVVAGGFDLDFGQSLGDLAGIKTTGSVIPLAGLFAKAGFGIDLSPSQSLEISPAVFSPGPRVDVVSVQEGGKAISVRTIRDGNGSGLNEIQEVTARGTAGEHVHALVQQLAHRTDRGQRDRRRHQGLRSRTLRSRGCSSRPWIGRRAG